MKLLHVQIEKSVQIEAGTFFNRGIMIRSVHKALSIQQLHITNFPKGLHRI